MMKENENIKKTCLFFASDYHFEMISLPYISKNLKDNKKVIVLTENDLEVSINKLLDMVSLNNEEKNKINNINWNNNNSEKFEQINSDTLVFVKGKQKFISDVNKKLTNLNNVRIVDCYDVNDVKETSSEIVKNYDEILSTSGISKL